MKFLLQNIEVEIFLGVPKEERKNKQKILVSLAFEAETQKAEKTDSIRDTIDYFEIYKFIKNFPQERQYKLLEKFYQALLNEIKKNFPDLQKIKLTIQKFPFEDASVLIEL